MLNCVKNGSPHSSVSAAATLFEAEAVVEARTALEMDDLPVHFPTRQTPLFFSLLGPVFLCLFCLCFL